MTSSYKDDLLSEVLTELRLMYQRLDDAHSRVKLKILTVLGGGLALLSYLYGGGDLFIPKQTYGKILYYAGGALVIWAVYLLFRALRAIFWHVPTETKFTKVLDEHPTKNSFLQYLVKEYSDCLAKNIPKYEQKQGDLDGAFFRLLGGGIILVVLKIFGG